MEPPQLPDDFSEFLRLLNAHGVDYLLVGGYAVGLHGYPRATVDLDIWIRPEAATPGVPPFRIEIMTTIDGVEYEAYR